MTRNEDTNQPKIPSKTVLHPEVRSASLWALVGTLVVFFALIGVMLVFWTVAHPRPASRGAGERAVDRSGLYWNEGGHDPLEYRRPRTTRDELKFRGELTPPSEARGR